LAEAATLPRAQISAKTDVLMALLP
jgi:hypothetical protein